MLALYIVVGIVLLTVLILLVPVDVLFDVGTTEGAKPRVRVRWLFGIVSKGIEPGERKPKEKRGRKGLKVLLSALRTRGLPGRVLKLVRQLLRRLHIRRLDADVRLGLDDPADTGLLCSVLLPTVVFLSTFDRVDVRLEPCFAEAALDIRVHGALRVFPIEMSGPIVAFGSSPVLWRAIASMAVSRWKRNK